MRVTSYHGNFMLQSSDIIALPAVDCDKAFAMQLTLEEALLTTQTVYFQVGLLYPYFMPKKFKHDSLATCAWKYVGHILEFYIFVSYSNCHTCIMSKKNISR